MTTDTLVQITVVGLVLCVLIAGGAIVRIRATPSTLEKKISRESAYLAARESFCTEYMDAARRMSEVHDVPFHIVERRMRSRATSAWLKAPVRLATAERLGLGLDDIHRLDGGE